MTQATVRGYRKGILHFIEDVDLDSSDGAAERHGEWLAEAPGVLEITFPDGRVHCFGTDPSMMRLPVPYVPEKQCH